MVQEVKNVVDSEQTSVSRDGTVVRERAQAVRTQSDPKSTLANIIRFLYGLIAVFLIMRFVLKLTGANPLSGFVSFVYNVSHVLSAPFDGIFGVASNTAGPVRSVFEPSILVALVVYGLVAYGITKLLAVNEPTRTV